MILHEKLFNIERDFHGILVLNFDECEDTTHQKSREHIKVLFKMHLDFDEVILRIVLPLHADKWAA